VAYVKSKTKVGIIVPKEKRQQEYENILLIFYLGMYQVPAVPDDPATKVWQKTHDSMIKNWPKYKLQAVIYQKFSP